MMIGIDIVKIERIEKLIEKYPQKALQRFLDEEEIALAKSVSTAAGFYAAKEAVSKALGSGISQSCGFMDIKIHKTASGAPYFTLSRKIIDKYHIIESALSITHDGGFAIAVAVITLKKSPDKPLCH